MGIIERQGIKQSIVNYIGVSIGLFNVLVVYPFALEEYGLVQFVLSTASIVVPFVLLGTHSINTRFFPIFRDDSNTHNGFLPLLFLINFIGLIFFFFLVLLLKSYILDFYRDKDRLILSFLYFVIPIVVLQSWNAIIRQYILNFHRIVVPAIFDNLIKIVLPILLIAYLREYIGVLGILIGVLVNYLIILIGNIIYLSSIDKLTFKPKLTFIDRKLVKEMGEFALFGILGLIGSTLATQIDLFMVGTLTSSAATGVYAISLMISKVIDIPTKSILTISSPIIVEAWRKNDIDEISSVYIKSSINLLVPGVLILALIWSSIDDLFYIMNNTEELLKGRYIVLFLGLASLSSMSIGTANNIIGYSRYFRFNFYATLLLALFNIVCNYYFINSYYITGAAIATLCSVCLFNASKLIFIKLKFGLFPLTTDTILVCIVGIISYYFSTLIQFESHLINIIVKSLAIIFLYSLMIIILPISTDWKAIIHKFVQRIMYR